MAARRRKLDIQRQAEDLLASPLSGEEELRLTLEARGVEPNGAGALLYAQWEKALAGDLKAAAFLRELAEAEKKETKKARPVDLRELSDKELMELASGARR